MAFRVRNLGVMVRQLGGGSRSIGSSTIPKMKPATLNVDHAHVESMAKNGEWAPVMIVLGMTGTAVMLAGHTAFQQLARAPSVHVNKRRRETMPEVEEPDRTIECADKFINRSMLRKVAHIQQTNPTITDTVHPNPFTHPRTAETLKTVGVQPRGH